MYFGIWVFSFGQNCPHYHIISLQCESFYLKEDSNCSWTYHASRKKGQCLATSRTRSTSITEEQTQLLSISLIMAKTCFSLVSSFCTRQNKWHVNNLRHPCIKYAIQSVVKVSTTHTHVHLQHFYQRHDELDSNESQLQTKNVHSKFPKYMFNSVSHSYFLFATWAFFP